MARFYPSSTFQIEDTERRRQTETTELFFDLEPRQTQMENSTFTPDYSTVHRAENNRSEKYHVHQR